MSDDVIPTGVPGLDVVLGGGLPRRQTIVVTGEPGSGKTILCSQIAFSFAARGLPVVLATVTSEPHDKMVSALRGFRFFDQSRLGEEIFLVSAYPSLKKSAKETREMLSQSVRDRGARLLFIDGLRSLRDLWQNEAMLREFLYDLNVAIGASDCIGLLSTEYPLARLLELPEATTVDGIVSVSTISDNVRRFRRTEVQKLRGRAHKLGEHVTHIDNSGIRVIPRLESVVETVDRAVGPPERLSFGLPELDDLLCGGLPRASTTLIAGSTGVGKTTLAAHFASAGAQAGERALIYSFFEPSTNIIERARRIGLGLSPAIDTGLVEVEYRPPLESEADTIIADILERVRTRNIQRLIIDSGLGLEQSIVDKERAPSFLNAVVAALRGLGVTTIITKEVSKIAGPELDFSDTPITVAIENFIFLRFVELRGRLHRILSVLKMRDSTYDGDVREFCIAENGFRVLAPLASAEGLLTGSARAIGTSVAPEGAR